jgi:AraC-like DNA-binding protein
MINKDVFVFPDYNFGLRHSEDITPDNKKFKLHNHNDIYEIMLFINGDAEFHVEGSIYKLNPYDIVLTRPFEMHHIVCRSDKPYERVLLFINNDYFKKNKCEKLSDIFENRPIGKNNLIPSELVQKTLIEPLKRAEHYVDEGAFAVANGAVIEFLYLLNRLDKSAYSSKPKDRRISDIIMYINENLNENITLDGISEKFYIDKYYLCKIFKKNTGYTLNQYINYKRLLLARELHASGQSLLEASTNAGFNNYSHFYRMCVRQTGSPPKNMI